MMFFAVIGIIFSVFFVTFAGGVIISLTASALAASKARKTFSQQTETSETSTKP